MELGRAPLVLEDLVDLSRCRDNPWYANIRINEDVLDLIHVPDFHPCLQRVSIVAEKSPNRYSSVEIAADGRQVNDFIRRHLGHVYVLSLFDVAIISGDLRKAHALYSIGVQQRCDFDTFLFFNHVTGTADSRTTRALSTAKAAFIPLYNRLRAQVEVLGRALAGKVDSVPAMLIESGVSPSTVRAVGSYLFGICRRRTRNRCHFYLRMDCLRRLLAAGVDLRSIVVNPLDALWYAICRYRYFEIRLFLKGVYADLKHAMEQGPMTSWRDGQTLLEMSIRCGQLDATKLLVRAHCETSSLVASDLEGPLFHDMRQTENGDFFPVTINHNVAPAEAARLAYHLCRHNHQVVLVQLTGWWSRNCGGVRVLWSRVIDHIASFALAVPPLPEILNLPRPMGTRNAARRAARRRAQCGHAAVNKVLSKFNRPAAESAQPTKVKVLSTPRRIDISELD